MRDLDEFNITDVVVETMANSQDLRFKQIMTSLVRHLHAFAREVSLAPDEWIAGIRFLTEVGQTCTPNRQEFILLSDTLGLSALVNSINSRATAGATRSSLLGPFFRENAPQFALGDNIAAGVLGEAIAISGRVRDTDGNPVPGARLDVWQTSPAGVYDIQGPRPEEMNLRGWFRTDAEGGYRFRTVIPRGYAIPTDGPVGAMMRRWGRHALRPAHIHVLLGAEGYQELATALYIAGDEHIESDAVYGVSRSLIVEIQPPAADGPAAGLRRIAYDFALAPAGGAAKSRRVGADPSTIMPAAD